MKYTILLLLAFVMGCTAQRAMYPHSAGRFPNTQTVGDQFQCEKELQKMSQRLNDTNDAIETLKKQLKVENEQLKRELAEIKKNSGGNVSQFKKQLDGQSQVQESLSLSVDQLSKVFTTKYEGMLNQMAADTNQLYFDLQRRLSETDMTLKETVNKFEEFKTKFEEIQTGQNSGKIDLVSGKLGERNSAIENLRTDFEKTKQNLTDTNSALKQLQEDFRVRGLPKSIGKMPTSCADLKQIGYLKSGVYSVMGGKNVLNVYCDFTVDDKKMEKLIGPPSN
ncbi:angiopoietin-1-like [Daphnia pulicaria]|uniref:angiopoietin-1-like n=1 Tax=Daphnia pulicaria TaxID=35523 RepID=UPI001EEA4CD2|nr:angiopoietin-1-like [Daphnia pulicaria]